MRQEARGSVLGRSAVTCVSLCRTSHPAAVIPKLQTNAATADIVNDTAPLSLLLHERRRSAMENFVSMALLLIVKVAEPHQTLPVQLPLSPSEDQTSLQPLAVAADTAQQ